MTNLTKDDIIQALKNETPFFITTTLFWDCECPGEDYIHPKEMLMCETCGILAEDGPDSRINEVIGLASQFEFNPLAPTLWHTFDPHSLTYQRGRE